MRFSDRIALWRLDRRLRSLQRDYYDADAKNENGIAEYFRTLQMARELYLAGRPADARPHRIHFGSGDHRIAGWINVDRDAVMPIDLAADLTREMPLRTESVDLIHCEDLLEHLEPSAGQLFLSECHRVLRIGGVIRILTPDLRALIGSVYLRRDAAHIRWCSTYLETEDACDALNMHMRMNGEHRYIYDEERLTSVLQRIGFSVRRVRYNRSPVPELCYLDLRDFGLNLFLEGVKQ